MEGLWENRDERQTMASTTASAGKTRDDRELAQLAVAGDGNAFAELYDRHERRVFGFCLRMLGNEDEAAEATQETFVGLLRRLPKMDGREVNFVAYALTTARNACYDTINARRRVEPVGELPEPVRPQPSDVELDPERAALLAATREAVRAANARLPERQREVLALRELEQLSYDEIGAIVGLNANAVAQLISRARIKLRDLLSGGALESIASSSPHCERALALLARIQDEQLQGSEDRDWVHDHLSRCETCRVSRAAMQEAGVSYRALGPIVVVAWLRHATIAHAAQAVGADWSQLAGGHAGVAGDAGIGVRHDRDRGVRSGGRDDDSGAGGRVRAPRAAGRLRFRVAAVALVCAVIALVLTATLTRDASVRLLPGATGAAAVAHAHARALAGTRHAQARAHRRSGSSAGANAPLALVVPAGEQAGTAARTPMSPRVSHVHHRHSGHIPAKSSPPVSTSPPATTPATPTTTVPATSTPAGGEPSSSTPAPTTETTSTTTTDPGVPGGPPESGEHRCALAAVC